MIPNPRVEVNTSDLKWGAFAQGSIAIGPDSTLYFSSSYDYAEDDTSHDTPVTYLYAVSFNGTLKWRFLIHPPSSDSWYSPEIYGGPLLTADGTVVISSSDGFIYAISPDGTLKWKFDTQEEYASYLGANIGPDGTLHVTVGNNKLFALTPDGAELSSEELQIRVSSIVLSPDGQSLYVIGEKILALDNDGAFFTDICFHEKPGYWRRWRYVCFYVSRRLYCLCYRMKKMKARKMKIFKVSVLLMAFQLSTMIFALDLGCPWELYIYTINVPAGQSKTFHLEPIRNYTLSYDASDGSFSWMSNNYSSSIGNVLLPFRWQSS